MSSDQQNPFAKNKTLIFILASFLAGAAVMYILTGSKHEPVEEKWEPLLPINPPVAGRMSVNGAASGVAAPADSGGAPGLGDLLPRLEAKVAANPGDIDGRILLAQTYSELGQRAKGLESMHKLHKEFSSNDRISFALGALLMKSDAKPDLQEALKLFEISAASKEAAINKLARVYQGQVMVKLGDSQGAARMWNGYLKTLPPGDERRAAIEAELAKIQK